CMNRKWSALAVTMVAVALAAAGASSADDEKATPLEKIMEKINKKNLAITKAVRTPVAFKKANNGKDVAKEAEDMIKLAKEAREIKDAAKKAKDVKDPESKWNELMDAFIKASEGLAAEAGKDGVTQAQAKKAHATVKTSCSNCHNVFRVEEGEDFK